MNTPTPDQFVKQTLKSTKPKVLKTEIKSWLLFLVFCGMLAAIMCFVFGLKGLLWLCLVLGVVAILIIVTLGIKLGIDKNFRKSFLNYLLMDDDDNELP